MSSKFSFPGVFALIWLAALGTAAAQGETELTIFAGYRDGGKVEFFTTGEKFKLDGGETYGLYFDREIGIDKYFEFLWSHQETEVKGSGSTTRFGAEIDYYHVGIMANLSDDGRTRPYLSGGVGVTYLDPSRPDLSSDARFSFSGAAGVRIGLGDAIGIRLEGRIYGTFISSSGGLWCGGGSGGGGCSFGFSGNVLWQVEGTAGLNIVF